MPKLTISCKPDAVNKLGVNFKGATVSTITAGSQAEGLSIKIGWKVLEVAGKKVPEDAKAVLGALATARKVIETRMPVTVRYSARDTFFTAQLLKANSCCFLSREPKITTWCSQCLRKMQPHGISS